ncbi:MAG: MoaD/ThiS family protein [Actinobacteria bacterium]|nr:MoaD/ThiS family protein [Actinomycetota bacterium]
MDVKIKVYGYLKKYIKSGQVNITLKKENSKFKDLIKILADNYPLLEIDSWALSGDTKLRCRLLALKDGNVVSLEEKLCDGEIIDLLPPIIGGG